MLVPMTAEGSNKWIESDDGYPVLSRIIQTRIAETKGPLFTTAVENLMDVFLAALPPERRQHYNCNCCRRFVDRFGGLVTIDLAGGIHPFLWDWCRCKNDEPMFFGQAAMEVCQKVLKSKVDGVFLSSEKVWGTPFNVPGPGSKYVGQRWDHFNGLNTNVYKGVLKNTDQAMAEKREDYGLLCRSLAEYSLASVQEAARVLAADAIDRSEKALGMANWFLELKRMWETTKGPAKANLMWRAVATAPPGFCHVKNGMIGTLLDDITAGMDFSTVSARWAKKMHPLQYQRPQTLKAGNIEVAEKLIEKLGAARSLERRFAKLADVHSIWRPRERTAEQVDEDKTGNVFGHLKTKTKDAKPEVRRLSLPSVKMTWVRFQTEVLPNTVKMQIRVPRYGAFYGLVTAQHRDAPPIIQWDGGPSDYPCCEGVKRILARPGDDTTLVGGICEVHGRIHHSPRNPVSWYFYNGGSSSFSWDLVPNSVMDVTSLSFSPPHWYRPDLFQHQGQQLMFAIRGCKDLKYEKSGGLFPEILRAEFREARAAIEAYSKEGVIAGKDEGDANGLAFDKGKTWECYLTVTTPEGQQDYTLDRWE